MALKPRSFRRQTTVEKSCVRLLSPAHKPPTIVADVSKPNQLAPCRTITCPAQLVTRTRCSSDTGTMACNESRH